MIIHLFTPNEVGYLRRTSVGIQMQLTKAMRGTLPLCGTIGGAGPSIVRPLDQAQLDAIKAHYAEYKDVSVCYNCLGHAIEGPGNIE